MKLPLQGSRSPPRSAEKGKFSAVFTAFCQQWRLLGLHQRGGPFVTSQKRDHQHNVDKNLLFIIIIVSITAKSCKDKRSKIKQNKLMYFLSEFGLEPFPVFYLHFHLLPLLPCSAGRDTGTYRQSGPL